VRDKLRPMIEENFKNKGFKLLFLEDAGWICFFSTKPAVVPDDFLPLKIFALSSDPKSIQIWKSAGYKPVALDTTAMLTGLKTGMIDVVPSTPTFALAGQFYRPAPNMLKIKWVPLVGGIVVTSKAWDGLKEGTRKAMHDAAKEVGTKLLARSREKDDEAVATMQKRGMKVLTPSEADMVKWRKRVEIAYPEIRGNIVTAELFDKVKGMLEEYRKK
ncbi:MAG: TRAP transporter substrate-binding protein DctP, partial [Planctomycetota bacterium]